MGKMKLKKHNSSMLSIVGREMSGQGQMARPRIWQYGQRL